MYNNYFIFVMFIIIGLFIVNMGFDLKLKFLLMFVFFVFFVVIYFFLVLIVLKSRCLWKWIIGCLMVIMEKGKFFEVNMKKVKYFIDDLN